MSQLLYIIGLVILVLIIIILGPFVTIWSINALFGFHIPYTFWSWFATFWIQGIITGSTSDSLKKVIDNKKE